MVSATAGIILSVSMHVETDLKAVDFLKFNSYLREFKIYLITDNYNTTYITKFE